MPRKGRINKHMLESSEVEKRLTERAKEIFTFDNLGAISLVLSDLVPYKAPRIKDTEFETLVHNSMIFGMEELIRLVTQKINPKK